MKITFLGGAPPGRLWQLLRQVRFRVAPRYIPRLIFLFLHSLLQSGAVRMERRVVRKHIQNAALRFPPIFILGHWRSGTTHLHYLLACDPRFQTINTYQTLFPYTFYLTEAIVPRLLAPLLPGKRFQDNLPAGFDRPDEDEIALGLLCGYSPYLGWPFPEAEQYFRRFLSFQNAEAQEREAWMQSFLYLARKLSWQTPERRLVFKSPAHTARIAWLLRIWPDARFIHIKRDPYAVYRSSLHFYNVWRRHFAFLQKPIVSESAMNERVLSVYDELYARFADERSMIPERNFCELRFEDLERAPMAQLERIYATLKLPD
ncbi:MAG: sulfotransferase, partial [Leptospiraceae bacterium]|nr:sulfotransferase [Leptospiraceae bacterium]